MRSFVRLIHFLLIMALLLSGHVPAVQAQEGGEEAFIAGLIPKLSTDTKVGQLFVVGFRGTDLGSDSDVADLISNYQVGGVVLSQDNGNIAADLTAPKQLTSLTAQLQSISRSARVSRASPYIPLFTALRQDGDGAPNSEITSGLTPGPSYMALGATWNTADAEAIGQTVGQELSALGVNFLLGPSLDVRTQPSTSLFDPGVNIFGGDPYWVGEMGQAYARGLQSGSAGRLAVAAKHFPGQGSLDDVSQTIDRSLADLTKIDLPPFLQVMLSPIEKSRPLADVLLTANVRYRGFNGNIRERTAPISVDADALKALLALDSVKPWRDNGGLLISDALGSASVRDYYATKSSVPVSLTEIALDAFQAGNDVLILDNLTGGVRSDGPQIREVIEAFRQKYSTDPTFQQRVDSALQRILRLKYRLYPGFDFNKVVVTTAAPDTVIGTGGATAAQVATDANTLLWPAPDKLTAVPPKPEDTFLVATDTRSVQACPTCPEERTLGVDDLARAISQAYKIPTQNITTTTFAQLKAYVNGTPDAPDLTPAFNKATWIVLAMQAIDPAYPSSDAAQLLLDQRPDLLNGKRVIGFMFGPPYGLTTQQIVRFTALYALYGKLTPNVDVAVQALPGEQVPPGRSPVNLTSLGYDLTAQTEPDPNQIISLAVGEEAIPGQPTPAPLALQVGGTARIHTGQILDRNGHPVPDGTPVKFFSQYDGDAAPKEQDEMTTDGVARTEFVLDKVGRVLIRATSEPALNSVTLQITISESGNAVIATVAPTPTPTPTRIPTVTPTPTLLPTATPTLPPGPLEAFFTRKPQNAQWGELLLALLGIALLGSGGYWVARQRRDDLSDALGVALWTAIGGLIGYVYFSLGLPGSDLLRSILGGWAALLMALLGGMVPLLYRLRERKRVSR